MSIKNYYASIAILEFHSDAIVNIESISVSRGECVLSGAWSFTADERQSILNVISGRMIIPLGDESKIMKLISNPELKFIKAKPFLVEAKKAANDALAAYETYKLENFSKRKKMIEPNFFAWPDDLDFNDSAKYLESLGKLAVPLSTPVDMRKTLAAAWLVNFLVDMWQRDEQERVNRRYVEGAESEITILPESWLKEFQPLY